MFNVELLRHAQDIYMYSHYFFFHVLAFFFLTKRDWGHSKRVNASLITLLIGGHFFYISFFSFILLTILALVYKKALNIKLNIALCISGIILFLVKLPLIIQFRFITRAGDSFDHYGLVKAIGGLLRISFGLKLNSASPTDLFLIVFTFLLGSIGIIFLWNKDKLFKYYIVISLIMLCSFPYFFSTSLSN